MLSTGELDSMRRDLDRSLPGTAVVHSGTLTSDGGGGFTEAFAASGTVTCRIGPIRGSEAELGSRVSSVAEWVITLPAETPVQTDDRIVVEGRTYNVVAIRERSWEVSRRVEVEEVT